MFSSEEAEYEDLGEDLPITLAGIVEVVKKLSSGSAPWTVEIYIQSRCNFVRSRRSLFISTNMCIPEQDDIDRSLNTHWCHYEQHFETKTSRELFCYFTN